MVQPSKPLRHRILFVVATAALTLIAVGFGRPLWFFVAHFGRPLWLIVAHYRSDFTTVPLDQSPFLRAVVEPITFTEAVYNQGSDDHWMEVTFKDAKQTERVVRFVYYYPVFQRTFILGRKVPIGGAEERAFLGLLQRWYRREPEVPALVDRIKHRNPAVEGPPFESGRYTQQQLASFAAAIMMEILLKRD